MLHLHVYQNPWNNPIMLIKESAYLKEVDKQSKDF